MRYPESQLLLEHSYSIPRVAASFASRLFLVRTSKPFQVITSIFDLCKQILMKVYKTLTNIKFSVSLIISPNSGGFVSFFQ
jgi:hypothetical protein